jgi:hypothetical protein
VTVTKDEAHSWIELAEERIGIRQQKIDAGSADQACWVGWSEWHLRLGRARFLQGDPVAQVREAFRRAAQGIVMSFTMAYDPSSPAYLGERRDLSAVSYTTAIDGFNAGLMAVEPATTARLAQWVPLKAVGSTLSKEAYPYACALKLLIQGEEDEALKRARDSLERLGSPPFKEGRKRNFFSLFLALSGIVNRDEQQFNEGLLLQSQFHAGRAQGEYADTPEQYFCDHLVALGRLGVQRGMRVQIESPFLAQALLVD